MLLNNRQLILRHQVPRWNHTQEWIPQSTRVRNWSMGLTMNSLHIHILPSSFTLRITIHLLLLRSLCVRWKYLIGAAFRSQSITSWFMLVPGIRESFQGKVLCYLDMVLSILSFKIYGKHLFKLRFSAIQLLFFFTIAF